jgi:hypothetical protein
MKILRWWAGALLACSAIYLVVAAVSGRVLWPLWLMTGAGGAAFASALLSPASIRAREYLMIVMFVFSIAAATVIVIARP